MGDCVNGRVADVAFPARISSAVSLPSPRSCLSNGDAGVRMGVEVGAFGSR